LIRKEKNKKFQTKLNQKKFIKEKCKTKKKVKCITVCTVIHFTVHCVHSDIKNRSSKSKKKKKNAATVNIPRVLKYSIINCSKSTASNLLYIIFFTKFSYFKLRFSSTRKEIGTLNPFLLAKTLRSKYTPFLARRLKREFKLVN